MHTDGMELIGDIDAFLEIVLRLLHVTFEQVCDGKLAIAQRHTFFVTSRHRDLKSLFEFSSRSMILTKKTRADTCVVDGYELIVFVSLLCMFAVVHVAKIILFALEKNHSQSVKGQSTPYVVV